MGWGALLARVCFAGRLTQFGQGAEISETMTAEQRKEPPDTVGLVECHGMLVRESRCVWLRPLSTGTTPIWLGRLEEAESRYGHSVSDRIPK